MGVFSFTLELAMDLGTANTLIIQGDKVVVDEPSIVAVENQTGKLIAIGKQAQVMHGRTHEGIRTIRPLKNGVIADFTAAEQMIKGMIKMIPNKSWFSPSIRMVICIPSGSTEVDIRAIRDSAEHSGGRDVYMIHEPMAAALGIGIDVTKPEGNMVIDIGGGTTEVAVISLGGIVCSDSSTAAGDAFTKDIITYMQSRHNVRIGESMAEEIKKQVGSVLPDLEDPPSSYIVKLANQMNSYPIELPIEYSEIYDSLNNSITRVEQSINTVLNETPPELFSDIARNGVYLAGGGALLRGLAKRLTDKMGLTFKVCEDPLRAVARGTGIALKNIDKFKFLMR